MTCNIHDPIWNPFCTICGAEDPPRGLMSIWKRAAAAEWTTSITHAGGYDSWAVRFSKEGAVPFYALWVKGAFRFARAKNGQKLSVPDIRLAIDDPSVITEGVEREDEASDSAVA